MDRRRFIRESSLLAGAVTLGSFGGERVFGAAAASRAVSTWPVAWTSYRQRDTLEEDIRHLQDHGVRLIHYRGVHSREDAAQALEVARRTGMKFAISLEDITEHRHQVEAAGLDPAPARMIGGVYRGKAIDRHVFRFSPTRHQIVIEPPVYSRGFAYTRGSGATGDQKDTEPIAHYYPDMGAPAYAEVVVPLRRFDGRQHLRTVPARIEEVPGDTPLEMDSVSLDMPASSETSGRKLYRLTFDLTGLGDAMLDHVGIAVYWEYGGTDQYWIFGRGNVSAAAASTQEALRHRVRETLRPWIGANGGTFPGDAVLAVRYGDECFYITGHVNGPAVNYPLWDYSPAGIEAFRARAGALDFPRTWGFPEIYGRDAYAWWMYTLHESAAGLCGVIREEFDRIAPGLLLFRNTTRMGVFSKVNDLDGSGQELLAQNLDIIHLDPYPVNGRGYTNVIPRDMSYCAGLARRYGRKLVPWMQAHTYGGPGGLQHVSPEDVERMCKEQAAHSPDAVMWLGWGPGYTFPDVRPDSWQRAAAFHRQLAKAPPPKPKARLAVLRPYRTWALASECDGLIRNPADWLLQQFLEVWSVQHGQPYDIFEVPPALTPAEQKKMEAELEGYSFVVSTESREGAWVIGTGTEGTTVEPSKADDVQRSFEVELKTRGWL